MEITYLSSIANTEKAHDQNTSEGWPKAMRCKQINDESKFFPEAQTRSFDNIHCSMLNKGVGLELKKVFQWTFYSLLFHFYGQ